MQGALSQGRTRLLYCTKRYPSLNEVYVPTLLNAVHEWRSPQGNHGRERMEGLLLAPAHSGGGGGGARAETREVKKSTGQEQGNNANGHPIHSIP